MSTEGSSSDTRVDFRETIRNDRASIERVLDVCMEALERCGHDETGVFAIRLAMEEALANAMNHGNGGDASKAIQVEFEVTPTSFRATIEDEGTGYDPSTVPDPTAEENLTIASGRGLALMKAFMTGVTVVAPGNRVELSYSLQHG